MEQPHGGYPNDCRPGHEGGPNHPPMKRHGKGRTAAYFIVLILLNILLAFYLLYIVGVTMSYDWYLTDTSAVSIVRVILMVLLVFSPLLLTIILNKILYHIFRGRRFFPRGTVLLAFLVIIVVQALTVMLTLRYGLIEGATGIGMGEYVNFFHEIVE